MNRRALPGALAAMLALAMVLGVTGAAHAYLLRGGVVGTGATPSTGSTNATMALLGTAGQPVVGYSDNATWGLCHGFWCFGGSRVVAVEDVPPAGPRLPSELSFGPPMPNPSDGRVGFALALPEAAEVSLRVLDVMGRQVSEVTSGTMEPGYHTLRWQARDDAGRALGSGVYFARLTVDGALFAQRRIVVTR